MVGLCRIGHACIPSEDGAGRQNKLKHKQWNYIA
jgi:hypothetical protein